ncbi:MAG TPA: RNA 2',3'-cyclic phosphodiesterase [Candidatus Limnocylindria bacterium]|nr:RNA 2',3'-cyclic phosphodiesterase [Candidatus Limnocylindria bacterium]
MRLFIAVRLPHDQAERATRILTGPLPALRRVQPELLHLTLAFLGSAPEERLSAVVRAVSAAASRFAPFELGLGALGRFPDRGPANVVWVRATAGAAELTALGDGVRRALRAARIDFDDKPFRPHMTLGRIRHGADPDDVRAVEAQVAAAAPPDIRFEVREVHVVESTLSPRGPRYASLEAVPLGAGRRVGEHVDGGRAADPRESPGRRRVPEEARRRPRGDARRLRPDR